ncbi:hypothetical protein IJT10_05470 [bacterium]|nr:hypothetical protein [bacterium]
MESIDALENFNSSVELWGCDPTEKIVNVWADEIGITVWKRDVNRGIEVEKVEFSPYLWACSSVGKFLAIAGNYKFRELNGNNYYDSLIYTPTFKELIALSNNIASSLNMRNGNRLCGQMFINDCVNLYLMESGRTLYKGLQFKDLLRLDIAVITTKGNWANLGLYTEETVQAVSLHTSCGKDYLLRLEDFKNEKELWQKFVSLILEIDPDILCAHCLFDDVLPYIKARAKVNKVKLSIGRPQGSTKASQLEATERKTFMQLAGKRYDYHNWEVRGRDCVDTLILARLRDVSNRELEIFSLFEVAESLDIKFECSNNTEELACLSSKVCDLLLPPFFMQAQIFPYSLQNTILRGNATKINSLFLRNYLLRGESVAEKPEPASYTGAVAGQSESGLIKNVMHCDVQSLYPSIMLTFNYGPQSDTLEIFLKMLATLRRFRLQAKKLHRHYLQKEIKDSEKINFYHNLQNTFKILINSFYGYLGFSQGNFADFNRASQVTAKGREILENILQLLQEKNCRIIEYDTDGVYFTAPAGIIEDPRAREEIVNHINTNLPQGINVDFDGFYKAMYAHTTKNYALATFDGQVSFSGATFRSRTREVFLREALQTITTLALFDRSDEIVAYIATLKEKISNHELSIDKLCKTEILNDSTDNYLRKISASSRNRSAAYEVALRSSRTYKAGQAVSYYITGTKKTVKAFEVAKATEEYDPQHPDENIKYYIGKLESFLEQFTM